MGLFRKQTAEQHNSRLFGEVSLSVAPTYKNLTLIFSAIFFVALIFLVTANYHRKQVVFGQLKPSQSVVTARAPGQFIVADVFVETGQMVNAGEPILALSSVDALSNQSPTYAQALNSLLNQREQLLAQVTDSDQLLRLQQNKLTLAQQQNQTQQQLKKQQLRTLGQRITLANQQVQETEQLHRSGHVATEQLSRQQNQLLSLEQQRASLQIELAQLGHELQLMESQTLELPLEQRKEQRQVQANIHAIEREIIKLKSKNELVLTASKRGFISNINIKSDEIVDHQQYLYTLAPVSGELYAELVIPSRAMGFVKPGQKARLKIDAFPYQKFGAIDATILKAATTAVPSNSLQGPFEFKEPVFVVTAKLNHQQISEFERNHKLQAGMLLSADIVLEQRTLTQWLFAPLLSLKG